MGLIGSRQLRVEDAPLLRGEAPFTADIAQRELPDAAVVHYVGSTVAHGVLRSIDTSAAEAAPGVLAVLVADQLPAGLGAFPWDRPGFPQAMARPWLATGRVRYVGEPIAIVVALSEAEAADAADLVVVDVDPLPAVTDPRAALTTSAPLLFPDAGTNVCFTIPVADETDVAASAVSVAFDDVNQRLAPAPIECRAAAACWNGDGTLTLWATTQGPFPVRQALADAYHLDPAMIRVVSAWVGGGFGSKEALYPEILLLPWVAQRVGRPVRWAENRTASMVNLGHGRGQHQRVVLNGSRDGRIESYRLDVVQDAGGYPRLGAILPFLTGIVLCGPYRIPDARFSATAALTTTTPMLAYRGAGQPEAVAALEAAIDRYARAIGIDPAEVRRRNLLSAQDYPYRTPTGFSYDSGHPDVAFAQALELAGYDALRAEQAARRGVEPSPVQLGIGLACFAEVIGGPDPSEYGRVTVTADGAAQIHAGSFNHGQGHATVWAQIVADHLGIAPEQVMLIDGDTAALPRGGNTGGSRSVQTAGNAIANAAAAVAETARKLAAELLEAAEADIVIDTDRGVLHVAGTPTRSLGWAELARSAGERGVVLSAENDAELKPRSSYACGAQVAVVEVDTETGKVTLRRLVAVTDAGRILNPLLAEGQVHGGVAQGVGQALTEAMVYDLDGNPQTANLADYGAISAAEMAPVTAAFVDIPAPGNGLGAKGLGESGAIGATAAVRNAVVDAVAHLGVGYLPLPCSPETVWSAINSAPRNGAA